MNWFPAAKLKHWNDRKGSMLVYTVILLTVAGVAVMSGTALVTHNIREAKRSEERMKAFYIAESGVSQVLDWFNRGYNQYQNDLISLHTCATTSTCQTPEAHPGAVAFEHDWQDGAYPDLVFQAFFQPWDCNHKFISCQNNSIITAQIDVHTLYPDYLPNIQAADGRSLGQVVELSITPPQPGDPLGLICRVISVGQTVDQMETTVETALFDHPFPVIYSPAGLISKTGLGTNGQLNAHWGEVWSGTDTHIPSGFMNDRNTKASVDPWLKVRAEQNIMFSNNYADGRYDQGYNSVPIEEGAANYEVPYKAETLSPSIHQKFTDRENLLQHQSLPWVLYEYQTLKDLTFSNGFEYYETTQSGGTTYIIDGYDANGDPVLRTFQEMFNVAPEGVTADQVDRDKTPRVVFLDTLDKQPPAPDGSNMGTLQLTGNDPLYLGYFFVGANVEFGGAGGSGDRFNAEKPDGTTESIVEPYMYGMLYAYGTMDGTGQGTMYGSMFANQGYGTGGTPDVYYDVKLRDPVRNRIGSRVRAMLWNTY